MKVQHATAALALAASFALATAGASEARTTHHVHHRHAHHANYAHHAHHADARMAHMQRIPDSVAHTGVMNAGDIVETNLPVDGTITVNGIEMGCTGIGIEAREEARWAGFPVRVEFSGAQHQYFPGGSLVVKNADHTPLLSVRCDAPWVLLRLEPGKYRMAGLMAGYSYPQSWVMELKPNRKNPRRIVFHFGEVKGSTP
jgi:hypothetical protein